ncbi:MAG: hypothetical protein V1773_15595 [bacterium]
MSSEIIQIIGITNAMKITAPKDDKKITAKKFMEIGKKEFNSPFLQGWE